jgi:hypothetical protein
MENNMPRTINPKNMPTLDEVIALGIKTLQTKGAVTALTSRGGNTYFGTPYEGHEVVVNGAIGVMRFSFNNIRDLQQVQAASAERFSTGLEGKTLAELQAYEAELKARIAAAAKK